MKLAFQYRRNSIVLYMAEKSYFLYRICSSFSLTNKRSEFGIKLLDLYTSTQTVSLLPHKERFFNV